MWMVVKVCNKESQNIYIASCVENGGVYHYKMIEDKMHFVDFTEVSKPMYMSIEDGKMYIVLRAPFDNNESGVIVYDIDREGKLSTPSQIVSTKGEVACHLCVDEGHVYCTNYISGSIIEMPSNLIQHSGKSVHAVRQQGPHPHFAGLTPDKKHICIADLGVDTVFLYDKRLNLISKASVPAGHGARHLAFRGNYLYCANELKSTLSVFKYDGERLDYINTVSILPSKFNGESAASAIRIKDNFCYIANRGHDSISVMDISDELPKLITTVPCGGKAPRDFNIIDELLICANELSDNVTLFRIRDGIPHNTGEELSIKASYCVCY